MGRVKLGSEVNKIVYIFSGINPDFRRWKSSTTKCIGIVRRESAMIVCIFFEQLVYFFATADSRRIVPIARCDEYDDSETRKCHEISRIYF